MDKNIIAYCGLYCSDCFGYRGVIADLARDLREESGRSNFDRFAETLPFKEFQQYKESDTILGAMVRFQCKKACRGGGGPSFCNIRKCCLENGFEGCWECDDFEICNKLGERYLVNVKKIKKLGVDGFLAKNHQK